MSPKKHPPASGSDRRQRLQMADIARLAGVSASTVSRALSGSTLVNEATRQRVQEVAKQFNYTVNRLAMELRSGTNNTIAVVVPYESGNRQTFADPFFHAMIGSLADALTERGFEMLLMRLEADRVENVAGLVDAGRAAGVILIGQWRQHDKLNALADRKLPFVVWGGHIDGQRYCTIGGDNVAGGRLAARHLLALQRRHIVFLGDRGLPEVAQRYKGFASALRSAGLRPSAALTLSVPFLPAAGRAAISGLLDRGQTFDAVFACSDLLAMATLGVLRERGIETPSAVAVIGYDDVELAAHFSPPLSTIRQPIARGAEVMVDTLVQLLGGAGQVDMPMLDTELVVRASTVTDGG